MRNAAPILLWLAYFASGACALIEEVVWTRLLKLTMGNTVYASSVVVSVFLGGLALGAAAGARLAGRAASPLRVYALLELAVGGAAALFPFALRAADGV